MSARRVVVVGGGLAGITAALDCAAGGASVTLVEVRPRLGGAAYSFQRDGMSVDNGQHVFLRCCESYRALIGRLGSDHRVSLQSRLEIPVLRPGARPVLLRRARLPAPLHLAPALLRYRLLSLPQRLSAARAALALGRLDPREQAIDEQNLGVWLGEHGQSPRAIEALWDLIALPALNLRAEEASLALGAFVFQRGLLESAGGADIGFHERPLSEIIGGPAMGKLTEAGVEVRLGWRAKGIQSGGGGLEVQGEDGGFSAERVILAVPHGRAAGLLAGTLDDVAHDASALESAPIVNLHVVYDRRICELPFAAGVGTPIQYLFDRTRASGVPAEMQYLAISLSGARREMTMSPEDLRDVYLPALEQLLPRAREARVERFFITREHTATFRAAPGVNALRPVTRTAVPGLLLAGAWTKTGWPATLEGAVLSGQMAAREAVQG